MITPIWIRVTRFIRHVTRPDWFWWIAGVVAILAIGVVSSWFFWEDLRGDEESLSTTIRNLGLVEGGIIAIVLAVWRSIVAQRQADAALQQAETGLRQADTSEQGLLNDRYQKGAEMLGNYVLSVRFGGIYALQSLAEEYPEQYHVQIMHRLCAFVRHPTKDNAGESAPDLKGETPDETSSLREDVQAVMQAIANRKKTSIALEREVDFRLDFNYADLRDMVLWGGDLSLANFKVANLSGAKFIRTDLSEANLTFANLSSTVLGNVDMSGARLMEIENFSKMTIGGYLNVAGADFRGLDLSGARLMGMTNLTQSQLDQSRADPDNPPSLGGLVDPETGERLVWRG